MYEYVKDDYSVDCNVTYTVLTNLNDTLVIVKRIITGFIDYLLF